MNHLLQTLSSFFRFISRSYYTFLAKRTLGSYGTSLRVNKRSFLGKNVRVGNNCCFNGMIISGGGKVVIGDNFSSGVECMIISQNHNYEGNEIPYDSTFQFKNITIGKNVTFENRVIVTGNVTIGDGAIIATGALVCKDVPPMAVAAGNPAKIIKFRKGITSSIGID